MVLTTIVIDDLQRYFLTALSRPKFKVDRKLQPPAFQAWMGGSIILELLSIVTAGHVFIGALLGVFGRSDTIVQIEDPSESLQYAIVLSR